MNDEEICPKCKLDKMPFDVHCDSCNEFSLEIKTGKKLEMKRALNTLGCFAERDRKHDYGQ